jgi:hypothetical protein
MANGKFIAAAHNRCYRREKDTGRGVCVTLDVSRSGRNGAANNTFIVAIAT